MSGAFILPPHEASLSLIHNDHKSVSQSVEEWLSEQGFGDDCWFDWVSTEQRQRAIEIDSVWTIQWYPNSPVGFCALAAADLDILLATANED